MADNLAPAPAGDQAAKTKASTDVPPELWLPESAPKAGADEATKSAKTAETAVAAAPTGESKSAGEPKNAADAAGKSVAPIRNARRAEPDPAVAIPAPARRPRSASTEGYQVGHGDRGHCAWLRRNASSRRSWPQSDAAAERDKKPATPQEPASKTADSSATAAAPLICAEHDAATTQLRRSSARCGSADIAREKATSPRKPTADRPYRAARKATGKSPARVHVLPAAAPARDEPISGNSPPAEREREHTTNADTVAPAPSAAAEPKVDASGPKNVPKAGWIVIPNSGKVPVDPTESAMAGFR